jgi:uncharacterized membrane protein
VGGRKGYARAALWTRSGNSWLGPTLYATPDGTGEIWRINGKGMAVGRYAQIGLVWNDATHYTILDGLPFGINEAGTIAVGKSNAGLDVYWTRNPNTGQWDGIGKVLPGESGSGVGTAFDVNDAGIIVGRVYRAKKNQAAYWRLNMAVYPPVPIGGVQRLGGLGPSVSPSETSSAKAISDMPIGGSYLIAGTATDPGNKMYAVRWYIVP